MHILIFLLVLALGPQIVTPLVDQTVKEFDTVELSCQVSEPAEVKWLKDGENIPLDARYIRSVVHTKRFFIALINYLMV